MGGSRWWRVVVLSVAVVVAGCGGGGGSTGGESAPATGAESSSATTSPSRADAATADLAVRATLAQADVGPQWTVYSPAKESDPVPADGCDAGTPYARLPVGARYTGPQLQRTGSERFVGTNSSVFPDDAAAVEWVEARKAPTHVECRRSRLEKEVAAGDARNTIVVVETDPKGAGEGVQEYVRYQLHVDAGSGPQGTGVTFTRATYRVGRAVIVVSIDQRPGPNDPADLEATMTTELSQALEKVFARTPG
ncbi:MULTISPECIES: hypothetical protein [unclassified Saccharothrix]|uniref:hypothetical protein n=1 Tax=unclassified Saccharothrix TaxID=2593673 RepID=UPI00307EA954